MDGLRKRLTDRPYDPFVPNSYPMGTLAGVTKVLGGLEDARSPSVGLTTRLTCERVQQNASEASFRKCVPSMIIDSEVKVLWEVGRNDPSEPQGADREGSAESSGERDLWGDEQQPDMRRGRPW